MPAQGTPAPPRREFGPVRPVVDRGTCEHKGNDATKAFDELSRSLVRARDRDAWGGVAPNPGGRRMKRVPAAQRVMADALAAMRRENSERGYRL